MEQRPILSIGMIFKNEIRCLERCLRSLQPLRGAVPCELVMADTGSGDGSREVAARYADILFDFPWINDFAAARNAVMDRASGEWFLTIDADEWLDGDIGELVGFLRDSRQWKYPVCGVIVRNYTETDGGGEYGDLLGIRMARACTGLRYTGVIHENWPYTGTVQGLGRTILHHDGYANLDADWLRKKRERNMKLLTEKLARDPEDVNTMLQCVESSKETPDYARYIRMAVEGVEQRKENWERCGPPILRYAVLWAAADSRPELEGWAALAEGLFPDSPYTRVDAAYAMFIYYAERTDYARAIPFGERYLKGLEDYRARNFDTVAMIVSTLVMTTPSREDGARAILADAYLHTGRMREAAKLFRTIDQSRMQAAQVHNYVGTLLNLQAQGGEDLSPIMRALWDGFSRRGDEGERLKELAVGAAQIAFTRGYREKEDARGVAHAYTAFSSLAGRCGLGTAAAVLASEDADGQKELLETVERWNEFPASALAHAIMSGVSFPLPERPMNIEEMDSLAGRMAQDEDVLRDLALSAATGDFAGSWQALAWARALVLAAVRAYGWKEAGPEGLDLARAFARVEKAFLPGCYTPEVLWAENLFLLPPMHRFGWYCAQAFDALEAGDAAGYVRFLRAGLESGPAMKNMVEHLTEHTPELQASKPSPELLALAEKVRTMLAAYPADDPAVLALKASEAYQKVAYLIEECSE